MKRDWKAFEFYNKLVEVNKECLVANLPENFNCYVLVIIPKDNKRRVRGIRLLETIHKIISQIIYLMLGETIAFCWEEHKF